MREVGAEPEGGRVGAGRLQRETGGWEGEFFEAEEPWLGEGQGGAAGRQAEAGCSLLWVGKAGLAGQAGACFETGFCCPGWAGGGGGGERRRAGGGMVLVVVIVVVDVVASSSWWPGGWTAAGGAAAA